MKTNKELLIDYVNEFYFSRENEKSKVVGSVEDRGRQLKSIDVFVESNDVRIKTFNQIKKGGEDFKEISNQIENKFKEIKNLKTVGEIESELNKLENVSVSFNVDWDALVEGYNHLVKSNVIHRKNLNEKPTIDSAPEPDKKNKWVELNNHDAARLILMTTNQEYISDKPAAKKEPKRFAEKSTLNAIIASAAAIGLVYCAVKYVVLPKVKHGLCKPHKICERNIKDPLDDAFKYIYGAFENKTENTVPNIQSILSAAPQKPYSMLEDLKDDGCITVREKNGSFYKIVERTLEELGYKNFSESTITTLAQNLAYANSKSKDKYLPGRACWNKDGENCLHIGDLVCNFEFLENYRRRK